MILLSIVLCLNFIGACYLGAYFDHAADHQAWWFTTTLVLIITYAAFSFVAAFASVMVQIDANDEL